MENKAKRSRGASFLKVLEGDFSKQLLIPSVFANNFNKELPHWLIIEVAGTRKCWRVDIEEKNGGLYITDGWDDFVEAHTLEVGNYLLFVYKGQFVLEVMIYDKDGSEKPAAGQTSKFEDCKAEDYERQHKTFKTLHAKETETCIRKLSSNQQDVHEEQQQVVDSINRKTTQVSISEKAVVFSVAWRETRNSCCYLTIPKAVVTEANLSSKVDMVLKDRDGKSWPIELTTRQNGRVDLTQGWKEFLSANQITDGDTLNFEVFSDNQILVHVAKASHIDHPSHNGKDCRIETIESLDNPSQHAEPAANSTDTKEAPEEFGVTERVCSEFRRSSFSKTWKKTTKNSYLYIPLKVANEQSLRNKKRVMLCDQEGTQWQLKVKTTMDGAVSLTEGWPEFRRRHEIVPGDTLNFEFVSDGMIKVNIDRAPQVDFDLEWVAVKQEMETN